MPSKRKAIRTIKDFLSDKPGTTYSGEQLENIALPLGGIGTGCVSLGGWGQLRDWEIFNRPGKGTSFNMCFFSMYAKPEGGESSARVLQGPAKGPLTGTGSGHHGRGSGAGLPHFRDNTFTGEYPFGRVDLIDDSFPLKVSLEAFNPFIPLDEFNSGLPCAIFLIHVRNAKRKPVKIILYSNLENRAGHPEPGQNVNEIRNGDSVTGLMMTTLKHPSGSPKYGSMAIATTEKKIGALPCWTRLGWFDSLTKFWDNVSRGTLPPATENSPSKDGETDIGTIAVKNTIAPGESMTIPVIIAWHFPNSNDGWNECSGKDCCRPVWKNYYGTKFADAWEVIEYAGKNLEMLESKSRAFRESFFGSTYPASVLDAAGSQISILKTPTCLRLEDGTFWGWEGCCDDCGCCAGTCSHVWNYAQAMPYLFPSLERSAREADYTYNLRDDGSMMFRQTLPRGDKVAGSMPPAADGQMGNIIRFYRDWLISGDDKFLKKLWLKVKKTLEFAWEHWDADMDGVMEGVQHNTYDIEFYGPNTMTGSLYLAALKAGENMASYFGENDLADKYCAIREKGAEWMDKHLFNGEWYEQIVMPDAAEKIPEGKNYVINTANVPKKGEMPKYQYGKGCLSDQLLGQWCAFMLGFGYLFDKNNVKKTAKAIFRNNYRKGLYSHYNPQRIYAQDGDSGLLLCSWPRGGRPEFPFPYSDEVWTGIEYATASLLIYSGLIEEGLEIVRGVRNRHDGTRRNPWDEYECGHHYSRAMSSYSLLLALSGFRYNAPAKSITMKPLLSPENFNTFLSTGSGWGNYRQKASKQTMTISIEIIEGFLKLKELHITPLWKVEGINIKSAKNGEKITGSGVYYKDGSFSIKLSPFVLIKPDHILELVLKKA